MPYILRGKSIHLSCGVTKYPTSHIDLAVHFLYMLTLTKWTLFLNTHYTHVHIYLQFMYILTKLKKKKTRINWSTLNCTFFQHMNINKTYIQHRLPVIVQCKDHIQAHLMFWILWFHVTINDYLCQYKKYKTE